MDADVRLHRQAAEWFVNLREDPDNPALRQAFAAWLAADSAHAEAYRSVELTFSEFGESEAARSIMPPLPAPAARRAGRQRASAWRRQVALRAGLGAAIAACLAIVVAPSLQVSLIADHQTRTGEIRLTRLEDGSTVRLGPDSAIAVDFASNDRTVRLLAGQAWFEVAHNAARPFRVQAGEVKTTVLGTGFDVRRLGEETMVSVAHGKVRVGDDKADTSHILTAGQWVRIGPDHLASSGTVHPELLGAWTDGSIVAKGLTVREVIDEIRPWYAGRIILTSATLGARKVSGIYDATRPEDALAALINPDGGTVRQITPWLLIVSEN